LSRAGGHSEDDLAIVLQRDQGAPLCQAGGEDPRPVDAVDDPSAAGRAHARHVELRGGNSDGDDVVVSNGGVVWWEIESTDRAGSQTFYGELFGWTFHPAFQDSDLDRDYWIIERAGRTLGGLQRAIAGAPPPEPGVRLYMDEDNLEECLGRVVALGGVVERARTSLGEDDRWFANVRDPQGTSFGIWTSHPAE
jgi:predicted enzyme related to lactoylglutathione lyase